MIVAGDFNATLDHSVFRTAMTGCADAAERTGDGPGGHVAEPAPAVARARRSTTC